MSNAPPQEEPAPSLPLYTEEWAEELLSRVFTIVANLDAPEGHSEGGHFFCWFFVCGWGAAKAGGSSRACSVMARRDAGSGCAGWEDCAKAGRSARAPSTNTPPAKLPPS